MAQRIVPLSTLRRPLAARGHRARAGRLFGTLPDGLLGALLGALLEQQGARFRANPRQFLWQAFWSPIWLGSNGPAPRLGQRAIASSLAGPEEAGSGANAFIQRSLNRLAFRFWLSLLAGSILRGIWLALLVITGWAVLALLGLAGLPSMLAIAGLAGFGAVAGAVYGFLHPIEPAIVAVMLDRTFALDERLTTAVDREGAIQRRDAKRPTLSHLQLADAANTLAEVMHELPRSIFFPVREATALLVVTLALLTALFAHVPDRPLPGIAAAPVPRFVPASERLANPQIGDQPLATTAEQPAPSESEVQQQAQAAQQAREDLGVLGEALQDHPITQAASDAIAAGDYPAASEMIRASASEAPNASPEEREALADDLDEAADQIAPTNPNLADSSREAADDLRQGGLESGDGLNRLADSVDETAGAVESEDQAAPGDEAQVGAEGHPGGAQPGITGQESESGGEAQQDAGSSQSASGTSDQRQQSGGDPGEGVAAEPGVADQEMREPNAGGDEAGEMSGASSSGQAQAGAGGAPDPEGPDGAPGSGQVGQEQPTGDQASSAGDAAGSDGESQGLTGAPDDETSASQGSGAGTGQSGANDQTQGSQEAGNPAAPSEGEGAAPPSVGETGDPPPGNGGGDGSAGVVGEVGGTNSLSLQGTSDEGVRTGGTSGSSSVGSGAGSGVASGDQVQQQVGVAGPDANRIPEGMQDIVQDFFTEPGTQP